MPLPSAISQTVSVMADFAAVAVAIGAEQRRLADGGDADPEGRDCQRQAGERVVRREEHRQGGQDREVVEFEDMAKHCRNDIATGAPAAMRDVI